MNTEKQLTAVEWLVDKYIIVGGITQTMVEQAKQMEKDQIEKSYDLGYSMCKINLEGLTFKSE
jgi:hypothetical protein